MISTRHKEFIIPLAATKPDIPDKFGGRWLGTGKVPEWCRDVIGDINISDPGNADGFTFRINGIPVAFGAGANPGGPTGSLQFNSNGIFGGSGVYWNPTSGHLGVGTSTPTAKLTVIDDVSPPMGIDSIMYSNDNHGAVFYLSKARGTTASPQTVQSGDYLGYIGFGGYVANIGGSADGASIQAVTTGVTANGVIADLTFSTSSGTDSNAYERMRLTANGYLGIGVNNPGAPLQVRVGTNEQLAIYSGDPFSDPGSVVVDASNDAGTTLTPLTLSAQKLFINVTTSVGIKNVNPNPLYALDVAGSINITGDYLVNGSPIGGGPGGGVPSVNGITNAVTIAQGTNVTVSTAGNTITINSTGGGGIISVFGRTTAAITAQSGDYQWNQLGGIGGTPSASTFLRGDGQWATAGGASGVSSFNSLIGDVTISAGTNVTLTPSGNNIQINSTGGAGSGPGPDFLTRVTINTSGVSLPSDTFGSAATLQVGSAGLTTLILEGQDPGGNYGVIRTRSTGGGFTSQTAVGANRTLGIWYSEGFDGSNYAVGGYIQLNTTAAWSTTVRTTRMSFLTCRTGQANPSTHLSIAPDGGLVVGGMANGNGLGTITTQAGVYVLNGNVDIGAGTLIIQGDDILDLIFSARGLAARVGELEKKVK